jgi:hypothetical protein
VPLKAFDETIRVLKSAVGRARLGHGEELGALKRLDAQARKLERIYPGRLRADRRRGTGAIARVWRPHGAWMGGAAALPGNG